ncbi:MAG TPA: hypothetical protein ENN38_02695 [Actinobacteria bacterium]|nr:hypothetical protein [Actinomycetota bacterium]
MLLIFLRKFLVASLVLLLTFAVGFVFVDFYFRLNYHDVIVPNVFVGGVDLNGLSNIQANIKLKEKLGKEPDEEIVYFSYRACRQAGLGKSWSLKTRDINLAPKINEAVNNAYQIAHGKNLLDRVSEQLFVLLKRKEVPLNWSYDEEKVDKLIDSIAEELGRDPKDAEIKFEDGKLKIIPGIEGKKLDAGELKVKTKECLKNGKSVNLALSLETDKPSVTTEQLNSLDLIAKFSTSFDSSNKQKLEEIVQSVSAIDGILLTKEEEFSFLKILGRDIPEDTKGGYSQVAATIYNAVLLTNLNIKDRYAHVVPPDYVPIGRDILVAEGKNFSFINLADSYIYIAAYIHDSQIEVEIYGKPLMQKVGLRVKKEEILPTLEKKEDSTLPVGEEFVEKEKRVGYKTTVIRVYSVNQEEVGQEEVSSDVYPAQDGLVLIGTAKVDTVKFFAPKGIDK